MSEDRKGPITALAAAKTKHSDHTDITCEISVFQETEKCSVFKAAVDFLSLTLAKAKK